MDFNVKNLFVFEIGGIEVWITQTIVNTWIIMLVLIAFAVYTRIRLRKFEEIPTGFQNVVELGVEAFDDMARETAGDELMSLGSWFFMVFLFVTLANLSGLVGLRPPTADFATPLALALATFFLIQIMGLKFRKGDYLRSFFEPNLIFFPLNVIGEIARPISLSFRLFGNILAGLILMTLIYALLPTVIRLVLPAALHAYFDLFTGVLQTYIFCVLSLTFIKGAAEP
ncbi:MAG: F0F1 ATP synthase subunit A [Clostridiales bacterium]|nr:F0F1 ATP synthase subunit A [Clostridiales bacterium]